MAIIASPARPSDQSQYSWRGALVACGLNAIGMPLDLVVGGGVPQMPKWPSLASGAAGAVLAIVLLVRRRHPTLRLSTTVFVVNNAFILVGLWITSGAYAAAPGRWIPFQANKIGALAASVLSPDLVTGIIVIGGFVGMPVLRYLTLPADIRQRLPMGEPWVIFIYAIFALAMLGYRIHSVSLARRMLRVRTESIATQRLARTFLALRDFTNTPLQTIELAANVVRARCPQTAPLLDRIDRSLDRLYRLNRAFSVYESQIEWTDNDVSPDADAVVDRNATGAIDAREGLR
jgi:hypothetical protein